MKHLKLLLSFTLSLIVSLSYSSTINKETYLFSQKDSTELFLDVYSSSVTSNSNSPCIMFIFGGGFKEGNRDASNYNNFFHYFAEKGYKVISIDYRLGMKDQKSPGIFNNKPIQNAISMAVSDLYSATRFVIDNSDKLNIDTTKIIISGSSAGAITVLQADYEKRNSMSSSKILSNDFQYAGVISFAGSIFSTKGAPKYKTPPAPTLLFHGSKDKLVPYNKVRFFNKGMFGSKSIAKQYKKYNYPYTFYTMEGIGHNVSEYPMDDFLKEIEAFLQNFIEDKKEWLMDINLKDNNRHSDKIVNPKEYFN